MDVELKGKSKSFLIFLLDLKIFGKNAGSGSDWIYEAGTGSEKIPPDPHYIKIRESLAEEVLDPTGSGS